MKKPVDFDWYCKTKKDVINNAAYELIVRKRVYLKAHGSF